MKRIKLYGGPAHGQEVAVDDDRYRIETLLPPARRPSIITPDTDLMLLVPQREYTTYYVRDYVIQGITEAGAYVFRRVEAGQWEKGGLMPREQFELERSMDGIPWQWARKPDFMTQFNQWFEYMLAVTGQQQPLVRF